MAADLPTEHIVLQGSSLGEKSTSTGFVARQVNLTGPKMFWSNNLTRILNVLQGSNLGGKSTSTVFVARNVSWSKIGSGLTI